MGMNLLTLATLRLFWAKHPQAERPLRDWYALIRAHDFRNFAEVKAMFPAADWVQGHIVFNISGNRYRLIVSPDFELKRFYIRFLGTHDEYDHWRPQ